MEVTVLDVTVKDRTAWSGADRDRRTGRGRVYVFPDDWSVLENLEHRRRRPYKVWKKFVRPLVNEQLGLDPATKWSRSIHAGCGMCACSPGFVLDDPALTGKDVFVKVALHGARSYDETKPGLVAVL